MYNPKLCLHWRRQERLERWAQTDKYWGAATMEDTKIMSHVTVNHFIDSKNINILCFRPRSILIALLGLGFLANLHKKEQLCLVVASSTDILSEKVPYWKRLSSWGKEPSKLKLTLNATQNKFENKFTFPRLSQLSKFKCPRFEAFVSRIKKKKEALCESWLAYQTYSVRMAAWGWPAQCNRPLIRVRHNNAMYQIYTMLQWYI